MIQRHDSTIRTSPSQRSTLQTSGTRRRLLVASFTTIIMGATIAIGASTFASPRLADDDSDPKTSADDTKASEDAPKTHVLMTTSMGEIVIKLEPEKAPITVANFIEYVDDKAYDGTIFHRVIPGFMIQGGGFNADMTQRPTRTPIRNEADNGLSNVRGTVAMARTSAPHSATCQFFINVVDNPNLDYNERGNAGYAVFGKVVAGMDVVDNIRMTPTQQRGMHTNAPVHDIVIVKAVALDDKAAKKHLESKSDKKDGAKDKDDSKEKDKDDPKDKDKD